MTTYPPSVQGKWCDSVKRTRITAPQYGMVCGRKYSNGQSHCVFYQLRTKRTYGLIFPSDSLRLQARDIGLREYCMVPSCKSFCANTSTTMWQVQVPRIWVLEKWAPAHHSLVTLRSQRSTLAAWDRRAGSRLNSCKSRSGDVFMMRFRMQDGHCFVKTVISLTWSQNNN